MKILFLPACCLTLLFCASCSQKEYRLSATDESWMPYKKNEAMVFASNNGEEDSLFVLKIHRYQNTSTMDDPVPSQEYYEVYGVPSRTDLPGTGIWRGFQLFLIGTSEKGSYLSFRLETSKAYLYCNYHPKVDSLEKASPKKLRTDFDHYDDVYVFSQKPHRSLPDSLREIAVTKFYWSKSEGLVRYEQANGDSWDLKEKFVTKE